MYEIKFFFPKWSICVLIFMYEVEKIDKHTNVNYWFVDSYEFSDKMTKTYLNSFVCPCKISIYGTQCSI